MKSSGTRIGAALVACLAVGSASGQTNEANFARNAGFEQVADGGQGFPATWDTFTSHRDNIGLVSGTSREGIQSLILSAQGESKANLGVFQRVPVEPGKQYTFAAYLMNDATNALKGSAYGEMSIEWKDKDDNEIARVRSKSWGPTLNKKGWERNAVSEKAPANADACNLVITLFDGPSGGSKGSFFVDDISLTSN